MTGNGTNYYRLGKPPRNIPYRKYVDWKVRQANIVTEGFDNDRSHGTIRLPESGRCHNCGELIINGSNHKPSKRRGESG